jgi:hypothetical protein
MTDERKLLLLGLLRKNDMHGYLLNAHLTSGFAVLGIPAASRAFTGKTARS